MVAQDLRVTSSARGSCAGLKDQPNPKLVGVAHELAVHDWTASPAAAYVTLDSWLVAAIKDYRALLSAHPVLVLLALPQLLLRDRPIL